MNADQRVKLQLGDNFVTLEFQRDQIAALSAEVETLRTAVKATVLERDDTSALAQALQERVAGLEAELAKPARRKTSA